MTGLDSCFNILCVLFNKMKTDTWHTQYVVLLTEWTN